MSENLDPIRIHAMFNRLRAELMKPPAIHPSRGQLNAFARLVREETSIPNEAINEHSVLYGWYYAQDRLFDLHLRIEDLFGETGVRLSSTADLEWEDPSVSGREMASQLAAAMEHELAIGIELQGGFG